MSADRAAHLAAATRRRVTETRTRAQAALRRLDRDGSVINYVTVAKAAGVSRALLYRDPELRDEINRLRDRGLTTTPRLPAAQRMSQQSRDEILAALRTEVQDLRNENRALRARLAVILGEERSASRTPS